MAMLKTRGNSHNVIYTSKDEQGKIKQQWETYATCLLYTSDVYKRQDLDHQYFKKEAPSP